MTARSATRRRAARRSASGARRRRSTSCSRSRGSAAVALAVAVALLPAVQDPGPDRGARRRGDDRGPAHRDALVLLLRRLVPAVRARRRASPRSERRSRDPSSPAARAGGELTTTSSPGFSQTLGSRAPPTPAGVPVETMSPGSSVIRLERWATSCRDREDQVGGGRLLHPLAVEVERDPDRVGGPGLVGSDDRRARRARRRRRPCPASTAGSRTAGRAPRGR